MSAVDLARAGFAPTLAAVVDESDSAKSPLRRNDVRHCHLCDVLVGQPVVAGLRQRALSCPAGESRRLRVEQPVVRGPFTSGLRRGLAGAGRSLRRRASVGGLGPGGDVVLRSGDRTLAQHEARATRSGRRRGAVRLRLWCEPLGWSAHVLAGRDVRCVGAAHAAASTPLDDGWGAQPCAVCRHHWEHCRCR